MAAIAVHGEVSTRGRVTGRRPEDDRSGLVDIEAWIENDREGVTTPASATVRLPRR